MTIPDIYDPYDDDLDDNFDDAEFNTQELLLESGGLWTDAPPASEEEEEEEEEDDDGYVSPLLDAASTPTRSCQ
ncbi:hypothetical protein BGZ96_003714 [Linnemannia gamsii]|uniref:Uncharacterized protein n=1 Tax=Linnemannia gamsii TaxID=64522 RepID=A0ABQ7JIW3_9FUNG|nr:hypothetical protein BGZ96_003714 [Linnemannia gamsii]